MGLGSEGHPLRSHRRKAEEDQGTAWTGRPATYAWRRSPQVGRILLALAPAGLSPAEHVSVTLDTRELQKLGLEISQATVSKYVVRRRKPPSQTWRTFLDNHLQTLVSVDFFIVPTVMFKVLFVFVVLAHERRRVVHFNVTDAPTAQWTAQQLVEAFPWETAPRYLLRDRDAVYGVAFSSRVQAMGIHEVKTAPRSPWQNPYVERLIGTLRRECLDHVVVLNETHLRRLLREYLIYYHGARTHLSLEKDAPEPRPVERLDEGRIVETPMVGGLHHRYTRQAA